MTEETPVINPSDEKQIAELPAEIVANPEFISWKYPPYCELCNVHFSGEPCSKLHFDGRNHKNRLHTWKKHNDSKLPVSNSKNVLCDICCKEMNTQLIMDTHCKSPAHIKEAKGRITVQKLKEDYRQLKLVHKTE